MNSGWGEPHGRQINSMATPEGVQAATVRLQVLQQEIAMAGAYGDLVRREQVLREVASLMTTTQGPNSPQAFIARLTHIVAVAELDTPDAADQAQVVVDHCLSALGSDHETTFHARRLLARVLNLAGFPLRAQETAEAAVNDGVRIFGRTGNVSLFNRATYAVALAATGNFRETFELYDELDADLRAKSGTVEDPGKSVRNILDAAYLNALTAAGRNTEAADQVTRNAEVTAKLYGVGHPLLHLHRLAHARLAIELGDPHTAVAEARQAADVFTWYHGPEHSRTLAAHVVESSALRAIGYPAEAVDAARYAHERLLWRWHRPHPLAIGAGIALCQALVDCVRAAESVSLSHTLEEQTREVLGPVHQNTLTARFLAAQSLALAEGNARARDAHAAVLADRIRILGNDHPHTKASQRIVALSKA